LEPHALRDAGAVDPRLPSLPVRVTYLNGPHYSLKGEAATDTLSKKITAFDNFRTLLYSPARKPEI